MMASCLWLVDGGLLRKCQGVEVMSEMESKPKFVQLFMLPEFNKKVRETASVLAGRFNVSATESSALQRFLINFLNYSWQEAAFVDENCQYCVTKFGEVLRNALDEFADAGVGDESEVQDCLEKLVIVCYYFLVELDIVSPRGLPTHLDGWVDTIRSDLFHNEFNQRTMHSVRERLIVGILKEYLRRKELVTLAELPRVLNEGRRFKHELEESLGRKTSDVNSLHERLKGYEKSFNFLTLNRAFRSLRERKIKEARNILWFLVFLGVVLVTPLAFKLGQLVVQNESSVESATTVSQKAPKDSQLPPVVEASAETHTDDVSGTKQTVVEGKSDSYIKEIGPYLTLLGFELVMLYFFKVVLHSYRSVNSQLLQLDLRVALTQFIIKYSDYAADVKTDVVKGTLERFEQVIFSSIVAGDGAIPATFDGLDQVGKVLEKLKP